MNTSMIQVSAAGCLTVDTERAQIFDDVVEAGVLNDMRDLYSAPSDPGSHLVPQGR